MHRRAMTMTQPGVYEYESPAKFHIAPARQFPAASPPSSRFQQSLHNHSYDACRTGGLINDSSTETPPAATTAISPAPSPSAQLTPMQKNMYGTVLSMQVGAIRAIRSGIATARFRLRASRILAREGSIALD